MPYVVTRRKHVPSKKISLENLLNDLLTIEMFALPDKFQLSNTTTYYKKSISNEILMELNVSEKIKMLECFYEGYKHLDVDNKQELYNTFYVPKASSTPNNKKWRRIDAPCDELKEALNVLKNLFEVFMNGNIYHTAAFAYIKGRCAKNAAEKHAKNKSNWFLKLDFSDFFGSTTPEFVLKSLSDIFPFSEIVKVQEGEDILKKCLGLCFLNGGLPQGTPMSPILTNIMMIPIDHCLYNKLRKMNSEAPSGNKNSYVYTRYADDMVISNKYTFEYKEIIKIIKDALNYFGAPFKLNDAKTKYHSGSGANWILGVMLNQNHDLTVGYKRKKALKGILTNYMMDRKNGIYWSLEDLQHLQGEIAYCESIEKETIGYIITEYSKKFGDIRSALKSDIKAKSRM